MGCGGHGHLISQSAQYRAVHRLIAKQVPSWPYARTGHPTLSMRRAGVGEGAGVGAPGPSRALSAQVGYRYRGEPAGWAEGAHRAEGLRSGARSLARRLQLRHSSGNTFWPENLRGPSGEKFGGTLTIA